MDQINGLIITFLANALWMTCVIAAVASLLSRALRQGPSSYRHALWVAALLSAVLLPFASVRSANANHRPTPTSIETANADSIADSVLEVASSGTFWQKMRHRGQPIHFGPLLSGLVTLFYAGFVSYRAVRLWWAWEGTKAVLHAARHHTMSPTARAVADHCHTSLSVESLPILFSAEGKGPTTLGIRSPVLVLPEWFLSQVSEDELSSTLCHELAHVRRHDFLLNLIYELLLLPISFHPAAVLIKARIDQTRELACDEIAAERSSARASYARSLLSIAQSMSTKRSSAMSGYALGLFDTNNLEDRIMNVLAKANRIGKTWAQASAVASFGLLIATCLGVSAFSVQVVPTSNTDTDLQQFVGTWHASFKGKIFETIKLEKQDGKLTGTASRGKIQLDKNGELTSAEEIDGTDPIVDTKLTGKTLRLTSKEEDEQDTIQFEMKLTGADQAELRIVTPPDVPAPKPWKLERTR